MNQFSNVSTSGGIFMKRLLKTFALSILMLSMMAGPVFAEGEEYSLSKDGYTLKKVVVLSRHDIRSPLSGGDSLLGKITPHEWFAWSSDPGELSLKGGLMETNLGQYFRVWLEKEQLIPKNYHPEEGDVRFYSNAKQRTIATGQYFGAAMLPTANVPIEYHGEFNTMDPVFNPQLTFDTDVYEEAVLDQIEKLYSEEIHDMADNYQLITDVTDMHDSEAWKNGEIRDFKTIDTQIILNENAEPDMNGSLKIGCNVSDALLLQYYEEKDEKTAAFGHDLTRAQWKEIMAPKELFVDILYETPLLAVNIAHPLLKEIKKEMEQEDRVFSFLCGHDSNLVSVMSALQTEKYNLPDSLERTPIGSKLVFSEWEDKAGERFISVDLVYATTDQIREQPLMDLNNQPAVFPITIGGLKKTADGMYVKEDFFSHLQESIDAYDSLVEQYSLADAA